MKKKMEFWKNEAEIGLEYSDKTPWFDLKLFKGPQEKFLWTLRTC